MSCKPELETGRCEVYENVKSRQKRCFNKNNSSSILTQHSGGLNLPTSIKNIDFFFFFFFFFQLNPFSHTRSRVWIMSIVHAYVGGQHKYQLVLFLNRTLEKERPSVKLNQYNGSRIYGNICQYMGSPGFVPFLGNLDSGVACMEGSVN